MVLEHRPSSSDAQAELDASGAMRLLVYSGVSETLVCYGRTDRRSHTFIGRSRCSSATANSSAASGK